MRGLAAVGFAGANVTIPHKQAVVPLCDELSRTAERAGSGQHAPLRRRRVLGDSTDGDAVTGALEADGRRALVLGGGGAAQAVVAALWDAARRRSSSRSGASRLAAVRGRLRRARQRDARPRRGARWRPRPGQQVVDLAYRADGRPTALVAAARAAGAERVVDGLEVLVRQGAASFRLWTGLEPPVDVMRAAVDSHRVTLGLVTAGESHGPALVAILTGLPAGLVLDREAIDADLRPAAGGLRPQPAAAARAGRGGGARRPAARPHARDAARARRPEPRPRELGVGMSPWPPEGEPAGKGTKPVTLPRPGHADLAGVLKFGHEDVRDALERRERAAHGRARRRGRGREGAAARAGHRGRGPRRRDRRRDRRGRAARRGRRGPGRPRHARRRGRGDGDRLPAGPRLVRDEGRAPRRAPRGRAHGHPGGEGRRDRRRLRARRVSAARRRTTRSSPGLRRRTNRAGGLEAGITNGEPLVVRAAMKPLPTLMRPLDSVDLATGEPAQALVERSDTAAVEALAVVAEAAVAWELARAAREVRRRLAGRPGGRAPRVPRAHPVVAHALDRHLALAGFMGAGKTTIGRGVAGRLGRPFVDLDAEIERRTGSSGRRALRPRGEAASGRSRRRSPRGPARGEPHVVALGGGAVLSAATRERLPSARSPSWSRSGVDEAGARSGQRPPARPGRGREFRRRYDERLPVYEAVADARARDEDRRRARRGRRARPAGRARAARLARARRRPGRARLGRTRGRHPRHGGAARARPPARRHARAAERGGGEGARGRAAAVERAPARPGRHARRARRRLHHRCGRVRGGDVPAGRAVGRRADDARRPGGRGDRWQDGDRPARGQEPRRRVPLAGARRDRPGPARDAARARSSGRAGRSS